MIKIIKCFLIVFCGGSFCNAQQALSTAGGEITGSGGTASFTIGQINYFTLNSEAGTIFQGIQYPLEIVVVTEIEPHNEITLECEVYPNPVTSILTLRIQQERIINLRYRLIDMKGNLIEAKDIDQIETSISLQDYLPATYFLKVIDNSKEIKTFKIIKSNQP